MLRKNFYQKNRRTHQLGANMSIMNQALVLPNVPKEIPKDSLAFNLVAFDAEINNVIGTERARSAFEVDGRGLTVAIFDTGLRSDHECFAGRAIQGINLSGEGAEDDTNDIEGHGTNVTGLIAGKGVRAKDPREGIAIGANVLPVKVFPGNFETIRRGLEWVRANHQMHNITVVNLSLGAPGTNLVTDEGLGESGASVNALQAVIRELTLKKVAVIFAAGNDYFKSQTEGMAFPAIFRECISVGAVYDAAMGARAYVSGAKANKTRTDQVTPFTQRLSELTNRQCFTTIFAPGAEATSAGHTAKDATSSQDGTSQAAPTTAGVVLLIQQFVLRQSGQLPSVQFLKDCLRASAHMIMDGDDEDDNVENTNRQYPRLDAFKALATAQSHLTVQAMEML
jgi:subtilisin family serine protease